MNAAVILRNEKECVERNIAGCTRDCANCDLLLPDKDILAAYDTAIALLEKRDVDHRTTVSIHRV